MKIYTYDCVVVGTGAAGYNAANRLKQFGKNVAIVTEGIHCGTSRNTGSDKQTYYKLGLGGDAQDSVRNMAEDLFRGGCMDGDNALCEAALSTRCFLNLCELGVPFPTNRYGEYVGYKTDHDPYARATSAGPLTSKFMTEALEWQAKALDIPVFDGYSAVEILKWDNKVCGLLCLQEGQKVAFRTSYIVLATGGPAGISADVVYPVGHTGSTGLALRAGALGQNLSLWQYGLASVAPRWNVSGTYMQVLPRFVSVDPDGTEHEFLLEHYGDPYLALSMVFLKGYQWPFDPKKAEKGSSVIDLLVHAEQTKKHRRVYLDFTRNPFGIEKIDFQRLTPEAYTYLEKADACFGTPIERLNKMNTPAIALYRSKGVDIAKEYLEIALCAQHCNGGIAVDLWWQTDVPGLFCVGECAGTHGIARPGGSALNAGQVGALRAAQYISRQNTAPIEEKVFLQSLQSVSFCDTMDMDAGAALHGARRRMSDCAGAVRDYEKIRQTHFQTRQALSKLHCTTDITYLRLRDTLVTQLAVLTDLLQGEPDPTTVRQTCINGNSCTCTERPVRPLPQSEDVFETVWRGFRDNANIY